MLGRLSSCGGQETGGRGAKQGGEVGRADSGAKVKTRGMFVSRIRLFLGMSPALCLQTKGDGWYPTLKQ